MQLESNKALTVSSIISCQTAKVRKLKIKKQNKESRERKTACFKRLLER